MPEGIGDDDFMRGRDKQSEKRGEKGVRKKEEGREGFGMGKRVKNFHWKYEEE